MATSPIRCFSSWTWPAGVSALACLLVIDAIDEDGSHQTGPKAHRAKYRYENLLSDSVLYCYHQIIQNTSCCLDQKYAPGVKLHRIRRPGTKWHCGEECWDYKKGRRGDDALWIPEGATCDSSRVLWVHGGSWEYSSPFTDSYSQMASKIAHVSDAIVMAVDYPLAPVGNYSVIIDTVLAALQWLSDADRLGNLLCHKAKDGQVPLFLGGDSAGGGTALSLLLKLKMERSWAEGGITKLHQQLAGAIFYSPWTNLRCDSPSYYFNSFAKIVSSKSDVFVGDLMFRGRPEENLDLFTANAKRYIGHASHLLTDPVASPFFAGEQELGGGGVPPLYFAVGSSESILGDSVIFAQKAALFGVEVQVDVMMGMWHDFPMYSEGCGGDEELWQAVRALNQTGRFIRRVGTAKRTANDFGLMWPPSKYHPGTPKMSYVHDLTREDTSRWYPSELDSLSLSIAPANFAALPATRDGGGAAAATTDRPAALQPAAPGPASAAAIAAAAFGGALGAVFLQALLPAALRWPSASSTAGVREATLTSPLLRI
eukprot:TRINITY_DN64480_c0_g1_i1.p1 TRINITY_DN64480_c0_g1~~TRINITY_DN64480_c0_g1_i1.p1  ORF type:complete len:541 (-),score=83.34 TRINITY_DN64480_c0_g1_i1:537-2159(-)